MTKVGEVRAAVLIRDGRCMAPVLDPRGAGPCRNAWGYLVNYPSMVLEMHHVTLRSKGRKHELAGDHIALCPGHHRGMGAQAGYIWATAHNELCRDYLDSLARSE